MNLISIKNLGDDTFLKVVIKLYKKLKKKNKIIIDTNLWISFLLTSDFSKPDKIFENKLVTRLFSQKLTRRIYRSSSKTKIQKEFFFRRFGKFINSNLE